MKTNPCKECGSTWHTAMHHKQKGLSARKPLNRIGKAQKRTQAAVAKWKRTVKSNHQGYYECYICHKWVDYNMAEHAKSKARHPDLRTDPHNLKPVCARCNQIKGSKDL